MNDNFDFIATIGFFITVIIIAIVLVCCERTIELNDYNDGICKNCGEKLEFVNYVGHKYTTASMYRCPKCGRSVEVTE